MSIPGLSHFNIFNSVVKYLKVEIYINIHYFMKKYLKLIGYGVAIWVVAYMVATIFVVLEMQNTLIAWAVTALAASATTFFLAKSLKISSVNEIMKYAFSWVITGLILDVLITRYFTGWGFFMKWNIWVSYALGFLVVILAAKSAKKTV